MASPGSHRGIAARSVLFLSLPPSEPCTLAFTVLSRPPPALGVPPMPQQALAITHHPSTRPEPRAFWLSSKMKGVLLSN